MKMQAPTRKTARRHIVMSVAAVLIGLTLMPLGFWQPQVQNRVYRVGVDHAPPFYSIQPDGRIEGMAVDVLNEAAHRTGIRLSWVATTMGADEALARGLVDIWPAISDNPERRARAHLTDPWLKNSFCVVSRHDASSVRRTVAYRGGPTLAVLAAKHFPGATAIPVATRVDSIVAVCRGAADAAFVEARYLDAVLLKRQPGCERTNFKINIIPGATTDSRIMSLPSAAAAADALRAAISAMASDGTLASTLERWSAFSSSDAGTIETLKEAEETRNRFRLIRLGAFIFFSMLLWQLWRIHLAELRARDAQAAAEQANAAKTDFLANMSHEIRTPLNGVLGMTHLVLDGHLDESKRPLLETVQESALALLAIINDILDLSKIEAGQMRLEQTPFDLQKVLIAVVDLFSHTASVKGVALRLEYNIQTGTGFIGDEGRVRQIVANFLSNAAKFTSNGEITVSAAPHLGSIRIAVRDTGIGIAPETVTRLFTKFTQADPSTTREYGGTGLGLAISKRLAAMMQGSVGVESVKGQGSTFWVDLPLPAADPYQQAAPPERENDSGSAAGMRILVVEDNRVNREVLVRLLQKRGCLADVATTGLEAVRCYRPRQYDLILMDCQMPEMDGYEATAQIRAREAGTDCHTPIVGVTASVLADEIDRCKAAGMDDHMSKPVSAAALYQCIDIYSSTSRTAFSASSRALA